MEKVSVPQFGKRGVIIAAVIFLIGAFLVAAAVTNKDWMSNPSGFIKGCAVVVVALFLMLKRRKYSVCPSCVTSNPTP